MDIPRNNDELDKIAEQMYLAYSEITNNKNFRGEEMPEFSKLPKQIRRAWRRACLRAILCSQN